MVRAVTLAEKNKDFVIRSLVGNDRAKSKLLERGFCIGEKLCVLRDENCNFIVKINECKYVLNLALASKILVEEA